MNNQDSAPKTAGLPNGDSRREYKVQGLSCANCAREMQEEIQKLDLGKMPLCYLTAAAC